MEREISKDEEKIESPPRPKKHQWEWDSMKETKLGGGTLETGKDLK